MPTSSQDREFISAVIHGSLLDEAIEWISYELKPTDVFSHDKLEAWAKEAGYELMEEGTK
jgi:hypothetical protein